MSPEKRKSPRLESQRIFSTVVKGKRLVIEAKNLSLGGAFLSTETIIRPGTVLVLEDRIAAPRGPAAVSIAAKVVHFTMLPEFGAGSCWVRAMSRGGMRPLRAWLKELLGLRIPEEVVRVLPFTLWDKPLYWDFRQGRFFVDDAAVKRSHPVKERETSIHGVKVKDSLWEELGQVRVVYSEAPGQKQATVNRAVSSEPGVQKDLPPAASPAPPPDPIMNELYRWTQVARKRQRTDLRAILQRANVRLSGRVVGMDSMGLFVELQSRPPPRGNRIMVDVKLEHQGTIFPVRFVCEIEDVLVRRDTRMFGLDLRIVSVNEGGQRGILRAWLKN